MRDVRQTGKKPMKELLAALLLLSVAAVSEVEKPTFVRNDTKCLVLSKPNGAYSREAIVEAQYRWLAEHFPDYTIGEHGTPKPSYLKKLGCDTKRGSILTINTSGGESRTLCFCLPAK